MNTKVSCGEALEQVTGGIIACAIAVHRILGPGLLESIYEEGMYHEFTLRNLQFERQKAVVVKYKGLPIKGQRLDLVVNEQVVVEVKAVRQLEDVFTAQVLSYLRSTGLRRALLINFGMKRLVDGIRRLSL